MRESIWRATLWQRQRKCRVGQRPAHGLAPEDLVFHDQFELFSHGRDLNQLRPRQGRVHLAEIHGGDAKAKLCFDHPLVHVELQT